MARSNLKNFCQIADEEDANVSHTALVENDNQLVQDDKPDCKEHKETIAISKQIDFVERETQALNIVKKNMLWSMGIGVIPIPLLDIIGMAGFQASTLKQLAKLYDVPFSNQKAKIIIASLMSGIGPLYLSILLIRMAFVFVPVIGVLTYLTALPFTSAAFTFATGKIFIQHFDSGGTFLNFNTFKVRKHYKSLFEEGLRLSAQIKKSHGKDE
jgi:uncharacterized protein (DUF697 family)